MAQGIRIYGMSKAIITMKFESRQFIPRRVYFTSASDDATIAFVLISVVDSTQFDKFDNNRHKFSRS